MSNENPHRLQELLYRECWRDNLCLSNMQQEDEKYLNSTEKQQENGEYLDLSEDTRERRKLRIEAHIM